MSSVGRPPVVQNRIIGFLRERQPATLDDMLNASVHHERNQLWSALIRAQLANRIVRIADNPLTYVLPERA